MTKFLGLYRAFVTAIIFVNFNHATPISKGTRGQKPFFDIDKCHNSVINYRNLPINNPKRDIVGTNAKFETNPLIILKLSTGNEVRTDVRIMDGRTDTRRTANVKT